MLAMCTNERARTLGVFTVRSTDASPKHAKVTLKPDRNSIGVLEDVHDVWQSLPKGKMKPMAPGFPTPNPDVSL